MMYMILEPNFKSIDYDYDYVVLDWNFGDTQLTHARTHAHARGRIIRFGWSLVNLENLVPRWLEQSITCGNIHYTYVLAADKCMDIYGDHLEVAENK